MNSSVSPTSLFRRVYLEEALRSSPWFHRIRDKLEGLPVIPVKDRKEIPPGHLNQHTLFLCRPRGKTVTPCPGSRGHICCNYITIDLYLGCPLGCAYCIMKSYLNFAPITVYLDPRPTITRLEGLARRNRDRTLRIGTGEVGDSLLLDPIFELSRYLIQALAPYPNLFLELKTKTHFVDHLLDIEKKGNTVIGFSLNPPELITAFEGSASPLEKRLEAARRAAEQGYYLSFHLDPIILSDRWEANYGQLIDSLTASAGIPAERVAWISLGTTRYTPELKEKLGDQEFLLEEFVPCGDGKLRYQQQVRSHLYREIRRKLTEKFKAPIYLCMESPTVWRNVFGGLPREIAEARAIFKPARGL